MAADGVREGEVPLVGGATPGEVAVAEGAYNLFTTTVLQKYEIPVQLKKAWMELSV